MMAFFPMYQRVRCGVLMALAGGAVAQAMTLWGGDLARFLPPLSIMLCAAFVGAGVAGFFLADAFGRRGWGGIVWTALAWPLATAMGASLGAGLVGTASSPEPLASLPEALTAGAPLGWMAVTDGITSSPAVALIWVVCGLAMHHGALAERAATS
ncbi:MAG: hypothetical protein AAF252_16055 [Pseudomonadota bacterium]